MIPQLDGVLETALYVDDLERSVHFYQTLFGFEEIAADPGRLRALGVAGRQVLLLFQKKASAEMNPGATDGEGRLHLAFAISAGELANWEARLSQLGITIEEKKKWPRGGVSLYFRDPDQHLLELATPGVWTIY
jgi:catechol 2,3-dioxygenase-like lactoylglutathione lyase family enzyme